MEIEWVEVEGFPNYIISNHGDVVNKSSGRWLHQSKTHQGIVKVGLVRGGQQFTRSVKRLVAEAFVPGMDEIFDTPIHLDGNDENNIAANIVWRPRWFAWEYHRQFSNVTDNERLGPVRDVKNRNRYLDIYEVAIANGLLFTDVRRSIVTGEPCFPTFQVFEYV